MTGRSNLSIADVAKMLEMPPEQVQELVERGTLPALRTPEGWRISKFSVDTFIRLGRHADLVPDGWQSSRQGASRGRKLEDQARSANVAKQKMAGFMDPGVRERGSLELDLSVLGELQIPPPKPPGPEGQA